MTASSVIREAWYWPDRQELELQMQTGRRYLYSRVPRDIAQRFTSAPSKGRFYNEAIRNRFPCRELAARRRQ